MDDDKPRTGSDGGPLPRRRPGAALAAAERRAPATARGRSSSGPPRTLGSTPDERLLRRLRAGLESMS